MQGITNMQLIEDVALITFAKIPGDSKALADIFAAVANEKINVDMVSQTAPQGEFVSVSFTVDTKDTVKVLALANSLKPGGQAAMVNTGNCKIQLYGKDMPHTHGVFAAVMAILAQTGSELRMITTSEVDISLLVPEAQAQELITALGKEFDVAPAGN